MNNDQQQQGQAVEAEEDGTTREFRSHCRRFYRRSTSVHQSSSSLPGLEDALTAAEAADGSTDDRAPSVKSPDRNGKEAGGEYRVVVEAVERLIEEQSHHEQPRSHSSSASPTPYATFLSAQSPSDINILASCGLPTSTADIGPFLASSNSKVMDKLVTIRTQERKLAHEVKMVERYDMLLDLLVEMASDENSACISTNGHSAASGEHEKRADTCKAATDTSTTMAAFATTREDVRRIRRTIRSFVQTYRDHAIASHPLLAGMRKVIQIQLGSDTEEVTDTVVWTFDSAVLTEAVQTKKCGGGGDDAYVRDALGVIVSFMIWIHDDDKNDDNSGIERREGGSSSSKSRMLAFAVNPTLSDRSLEKILEVLPVDKDLHGRPTGEVVVGGRERTNIDGDMDEIDFCQQVLREAFGGLKLCCPR